MGRKTKLFQFYAVPVPILAGSASWSKIEAQQPKKGSANGLIGVVHWPTAAMTSGAGVIMGDPQ
jgi:hypothetical protein